MSFPPPEVQQLVTQVAALLRERGQTLAISEAACGGLLSAYLVSVPGALAFYIGGKLVYLLKQRLKLSGWSDADIASYMGPLEQVALKLARTTKYELGSTYVLSETGFAGPSTDLHLANVRRDVGAVGTVYLGLCGPRGDVACTRTTASADRLHNMTQFAKLGLEFLLAQLQKDAPLPA
jgi:nicotinamide mononucleotide (NMN) deamidase PncC